MSHDAECRRLAAHFLGDYRLSAEELGDEMQRLADAIQQTVEAELENLAHRRKP